MKTIKKCGPTIESIKLLNKTRKGCLPENCKACRFFSEEIRNDGDCGWCSLARGRLVEEFMDGVDCPLPYMEGVDERIWGIEDTNGWHGPWQTEVLPNEIYSHKAQKIGKLISFLKAELLMAKGLDARVWDNNRFTSLSLVKNEEEFFETFGGITLEGQNEIFRHFDVMRTVKVDKGEIAVLEDVGNVFVRVQGVTAEEKPGAVPVYLVKATLRNGQEYLFASVDEDATDIMREIGK